MENIVQADWSKTKAYSLGLGSIYINLKGREPNGSVDPADYDKVCDEIIAALEAWRNDRPESKNDPKIVKAVHKRSQIYSGDWWKEEIGPDGYVRKAGAPDLVVGLERGYRIGWGTAIAGVGATALSDNPLNWSGDHVSVEADLVRGIFFANRKLAKPVDDISLMDIAPTVLTIFGVPVPGTMDGKPIPLQ
jgi:predicted AlkP superfamily phosphohydrolase/phosphomutase